MEYFHVYLQTHITFQGPQGTEVYLAHFILDSVPNKDKLIQHLLVHSIRVFT